MCVVVPFFILFLFIYFIFFFFISCIVSCCAENNHCFLSQCVFSPALRQVKYHLHINYLIQKWTTDHVYNITGGTAMDTKQWVRNAKKMCWPKSNNNPANNRVCECVCVCAQKLSICLLSVCLIYLHRNRIFSVSAQSFFHAFLVSLLCVVSLCLFSFSIIIIIIYFFPFVSFLFNFFVVVVYWLIDFELVWFAGVLW